MGGIGRKENVKHRALPPPDRAPLAARPTQPHLTWARKGSCKGGGHRDPGPTQTVPHRKGSGRWGSTEGRGRISSILDSGPTTQCGGRIRTVSAQQTRGMRPPPPASVHPRPAADMPPRAHTSLHPPRLGHNFPERPALPGGCRGGDRQPRAPKPRLRGYPGASLNLLIMIHACDNNLIIRELRERH